MMLNRYIVKVFFDCDNSVVYDVIPVIETSKNEILRKLDLNSRDLKSFDIYNYTFYSEDYLKHGVQIFSIEEFFDVDSTK